ncbi:hypothetical protein G7Y89_g7020 [Cudoniella acicularis]|uniref:Uncharacterized protein n=1 Tax=Cudoniella acicularis TaxID=354080 RepID=A0A8H4RKW0_9HELO|nr:hypothetical protein G7Y89_g7020 [Cudoniella acicularis]
MWPDDLIFDSVQSRRTVDSITPHFPIASFRNFELRTLNGCRKIDCESAAEERKDEGIGRQPTGWHTNGASRRRQRVQDHRICSPRAIRETEPFTAWLKRPEVNATLTEGDKSRSFQTNGTVGARWRLDMTSKGVRKRFGDGPFERKSTLAFYVATSSVAIGDSIDGHHVDVANKVALNFSKIDKTKKGLESQLRSLVQVRNIEIACALEDLKEVAHFDTHLQTIAQDEPDEFTLVGGESAEILREKGSGIVKPRDTPPTSKPLDNGGSASSAADEHMSTDSASTEATQQAGRNFLHSPQVSLDTSTKRAKIDQAALSPTALQYRWEEANIGYKAPRTNKTPVLSLRNSALPETIKDLIFREDQSDPEHRRKPFEAHGRGETKCWSAQVNPIGGWGALYEKEKVRYNAATAYTNGCHTLRVLKGDMKIRAYQQGRHGPLTVMASNANGQYIGGEESYLRIRTKFHFFCFLSDRVVGFIQCNLKLSTGGNRHQRWPGDFTASGTEPTDYHEMFRRKNYGLPAITTTGALVRDTSKKSALCGSLLQPRDDYVQAAAPASAPASRETGNQVPKIIMSMFVESPAGASIQEARQHFLSLVRLRNRSVLSS